ncbi:hypothetical protein AB0J86_11310 [Micromonospora sp. NPDC049559]|uniref:hypothetical protein n=1 Tax=Micromonospora sp. NPDC049559 TaxID=3155923 RepID=UPI0034466EEB
MTRSPSLSPQSRSRGGVRPAATEDRESNGRHRAAHAREPEEAGPSRGRRILWLLPVVALVGGVVLFVAALLGRGAPGTTPPQGEAAPEVGVAVSVPAPTPDSTDWVNSLTPAATAGGATATPTGSPSVTPSGASPTAGAASVTATPTAPPASPAAPPPPAQPVLLGPGGNGQLESMVGQYCDRHYGGSWVDTDGGRWRCERLLSSKTVDMNVACRDRYGSDAFAQTSNSRDPYAWRCYRAA